MNPLFLVIAGGLAVPILETPFFSSLLTMRTSFTALSLPTCLAVGALLARISRETTIKPKVQWPIAAVHLGTLLFLFVFRNHHVDVTRTLPSVPLALVWLTVFAVSFASSFFIFLPVREVIERTRRLQGIIIPFSLAAGSQLLYAYLNLPFWSWVGAPTTKAIQSLMALSGMDTHYEKLKNQAHLLSIEGLGVEIGAPCSGLEGVFILLFVFSIFLVLDWQGPTRRQLQLALAGVAYMLVVNALRITVFFGIGLYLHRTQEDFQVAKLTHQFFHSHIGWIFYGTGIAAFFWVFRKMIQPGSSSMGAPTANSER